MLYNVVSVSAYSKVNQQYMYKYPCFLDFLPIWVTSGHWVESPVLYSKFLLVVYFIHSINSVYMSIQSPNSSHPLFPTWYPCLVLYICVSISVLQIRSSIPFFKIPHICVNIWHLFFSFSLSSLCITV